MTNRIPESSPPVGCSRRVALKQCATGLIAAGGLTSVSSQPVAAESAPSQSSRSGCFIHHSDVDHGFESRIVTSNEPSSIPRRECGSPAGR